MKIKTNSKEITKGDTFIAIKGSNVDGHNYIEEAIKNGANKIITEKEINYEIDKIIVEDTKEYLNNYLKETYKKEIENMKFIGITGTNGKTSTAYITYQILEKLNINCAYIGTIGFYMKKKFIKELKNTTPDILEIYNLILQAKENNCSIVVMEVSSHALEMKRLEGINFDVVAFTNLTHDHLDYHKNMDNYLNSKQKIINKIKNNGKIIVNIDDTYGKYFICNNSLTLGKKKSNYQIIKTKYKKNKTVIKFKNKNKKYKIKTNFKFEFNVYNFLTSLAIVNNLGYKIKDIIKISNKINPPVGRCESYKIKKGLVIIDYAHTPDAVLKIIDSTNKIKKKRLIVVIGCGGNRDKKKRKEMGKIVTDLSDYVIFTNDNPRMEDEKLIINDIISNVFKTNYEIILDRKKAIYKALDIMTKNDIVLILGKGHENYQIIKNKKIHFSDLEEIKKYCIEKDIKL